MKTKDVVKPKVEMIVQLLSEVRETNGDLFDQLGILVDDVYEALFENTGTQLDCQVEDLLKTIDNFKDNVKKRFKKK